MSRFPKADLDALKATVDLARIVRQVVELKPQGQDLVGCCPFHDEETPSFKVTPAKGLWHFLLLGGQRRGRRRQRSTNTNANSRMRPW